MCFHYARFICDVFVCFSLFPSVPPQFVEMACEHKAFEVRIVRKSTTLTNLREGFTINVQMRPPKCKKPLSSKINLQI